MEIDPIVLLAYVSVAINIITMVAAAIAYAIFHVGKRRRQRVALPARKAPAEPFSPIFLRPYPLAAAWGLSGPDAAGRPVAADGPGATLADLR
jgi:hypothetical protein